MTPRQSLRLTANCCCNALAQQKATSIIPNPSIHTFTGCCWADGSTFFNAALPLLMAPSMAVRGSMTCRSSAPNAPAANR